jgi:SdpC family antimicrobial peptide
VEHAKRERGRILMKESMPQSEPKQKNRRRIFGRYAAGIAVVLTVAITVSFLNGSYSVAEPVQLRPYDGLTLYRAFFFGQGPVVSKIPSLSKVARYFPTDYKNLEGPITNYIRKKDPTFFEQFGRDIQSGDRVKVSAAIRRGNRLQKEALIEVTKNSRTQFASQVRRLQSRPGPASEPEPENDANVAVEVVVWVALFVAIVIWLVAEKTPPNELKGLRFEQYVDEIVRTMPRTGAVREARP